MIHWSAFDWPSFATLATGLMAVAAATFIGMRQARIAERQVRIADRQTEILARQTDLAELALRHDLYEKRYAVYESVVAWLRAQLSVRRDKAEEADFIFGSATQQARFLFGQETVAKIDAIWNHGIDYQEAIDELEASADHDGPEHKARRDRRKVTRQVLMADMRELGDIFGVELSLSTLRSEREPDPA